LKLISYVLPGVLSHHEAMDGSGYPHKLKGEAIPLYGRIIAVADSYDAMTSDRPYRKGMPTAKAEKIISEGSGTQWDPVIVQAFLKAIDDIYEICGTGPSQIAARSESDGPQKNFGLPSISIANWGLGGLEQGASQN
jgi:HD-GYP domain-containing protein (c-di-GMP phosphodiesterase class II)